MTHKIDPIKNSLNFVSLERSGRESTVKWPTGVLWFGFVTRRCCCQSSALPSGLEVWNSQFMSSMANYFQLSLPQWNPHFSPCVSSYAVRRNESFLKKLQLNQVLFLSFFQIKLQAMFKWGIVGVSELPICLYSHPTSDNLSLSRF